MESLCKRLSLKNMEYKMNFTQIFMMGVKEFLKKFHIIKMDVTRLLN